MASTALKNPRLYQGKQLEKKRVLAADSQTWKAGQPGVYSSGLATPAATNAVSVQFLFSSDQDSSTSSTEVWIEEIPSASTKFVGYVSNDSTDTRATQALIGAQYAIDVISNVATVNTGEASKVAVQIDDLLWKREGAMNASSDNPGQVIFHYLQSVLDA